MYKNVCKGFTIGLAFFVTLVFSANAATDSFTISTLVGGDVTPPTVPANLTAAAVSDSQIDLDWDPSSDNVSVSGYQVYRDAVQVATTSLTSYSDTGLASSTLYSYYVIAFDASFNFSGSSTPSSTTTLNSVTPVAPETSGPSGYFPDIDVSDLTYVVGERFIEITFGTVARAQSVVRWGRTADYESGYISSSALKRDHRIYIGDLEPGTRYEIEIFLSDRLGKKTELHTLVVTTDTGPDVLPPPNVWDLSAVVEGDRVVLSWQNPPVDDFSHVRVLSNDLFYPTHSADGWHVADVTSETVLDDRRLPDNARRYYTVFAYDRSGNVSSGAVVYAERGVTDELFIDATSSVDTVGTDPLFTFDDVYLAQDGSTLKPSDGVVVVRGDKNVTFILPYELLPEELKTIVVTMQDPEDRAKTFSFLLRVNSDKSAYEAHVAPLQRGGMFSTDVVVFNYKTRVRAVVSGQIVVDASTVQKDTQATHTFFFRDGLYSFWFSWKLFVLFILLLCIVLYLHNKRKKYQEHDTES